MSRPSLAMQVPAAWSPWTEWKKFGVQRSRSRKLIVGSLEIGRLTQFETLPDEVKSLADAERVHRLRGTPFVLMLTDWPRTRPFQSEAEAREFANRRIGA